MELRNIPKDSNIPVKNERFLLYKFFFSQFLENILRMSKGVFFFTFSVFFSTADFSKAKPQQKQREMAKQFTYVFVPADPSQEVSEKIMKYTAKTEVSCLTEYLQV